MPFCLPCLCPRFPKHGHPPSAAQGSAAFLPVFTRFILWQNRKEKADNPRSYQLFRIYYSLKETGAVGIEPTSMVLETTVLPLNYAPICCPFTEPRIVL